MTEQRWARHGSSAAHPRIYAALSVLPWLWVCWASCSGERSPTQCADVPAPGDPRTTRLAVVTRPEGLLDEYWSCTDDAECKSGLCWRGICYWKPPVPDAGGPTPLGEGCSQDADCQTAFCDRGLCAQPFLPVEYGHACEPPQNRHERVRTCGAYICAEGRCRSCQSDAECLYWTGSEACAAFRGPDAGKTCGRLFDGGLPPDMPAATPPPMRPEPRPSSRPPQPPPADMTPAPARPSPWPPGQYPQTPQVDPTGSFDNPVTPCPPR